MEENRKIEWDSVEQVSESVVTRTVVRNNPEFVYTVSYRGCGDRVSYKLQALAPDGGHLRYTVKAGRDGVKLAYCACREGAHTNIDKVIDVPKGQSYTITDPYPVMHRFVVGVRDRVQTRDVHAVKLVVLGSHRLLVSNGQDGDRQSLFAWNSSTGRPDNTGSAVKADIKSECVIDSTSPDCTEAEEQPEPCAAETGGNDSATEQNTVRGELSRRNDVIFNSVDTTSCTAYDTREGERWVFFSHDGAARISPLKRKGGHNTFRASFEKFNAGVDIPYVCIDGGKLWAVRGEHSAIVLNGPVIDESKLFQVHPSGIEGGYKSWRMTFDCPDHYSLMVVPTGGGTVVRIASNGEEVTPNERHERVYGGIPIVKPVVLDNYNRVTVVSGSCMVFALHKSLNASIDCALGILDMRASKAVVDDDGSTVWLPMLHPDMYQLNRERRDTACVHALCMGIPSDIAPDETSVAMYHLDDGRGTVHAVGGDVYYSLETYRDAHNVMHTDGKIASGSAIAVRTGKFTRLALHGPHVIRPLHPGQVSNIKDVEYVIVQADLEMRYNGDVVSVTTSDGEVELPKGFRRTSEHSIRYLASELAYKAAHKATPAKDVENEPPCPEVAPHGSVSEYYKVLFRDCTVVCEGDVHKTPCYVLVSRAECDGRVEAAAKAAEVVKEWLQPAEADPGEAEVSDASDADRITTDKVVPCTPKGLPLFHTVRFHDVVLEWEPEGGGTERESVGSFNIYVPCRVAGVPVEAGEVGGIVLQAVDIAEKRKASECGKCVTMRYRYAKLVC